MSYIDKLLQGQEVQWKTLGEVAEIKRGRRVTKADLSDNGLYPVYSGGVTPMGYYKSYNNEANTITIVKYGTAGYVNFIKERFWANDVCYCITPSSLLSNKYLYYVLKNNQENITSLVIYDAVPAHLPTDLLSRLSIPVPPMSVQEKIVEILDKFTTLEAELEAELDCRKRQYAYYRTHLLDFSDEMLKSTDWGNLVQWKSLGEVGTFVRGTGLQKKDLTDRGVPAIHYGQIYTHYGVHATEVMSYVSEKTASTLRKVEFGDVIITNTSENIDDVCKAVTYLVDEQGVTGAHACIFKPSVEIIGKYVAYYTQTDVFYNQKRKFAKGAKVIDVSTTDLAKIKVPVPPISVQEKIVKILDKFDTLTNSITEGLPKEIELRRKQYEYYREQLLSF